jgi:ribonuclease P protein component
MDITPVLNDVRVPTPSTHRRLGSLSQAADFQRLLSVRPRAKTVHFVIHHLAGSPTMKVWTPKANGPTGESVQPSETDLPTGSVLSVDKSVQNLFETQPSALAKSVADDGVWLGMVIPKKQAKRAVTRNLVRRQMREAAGRFLRSGVSPTGTDGLWLLRLKQGFSHSEFPSADSLPLRRLVRQELDQLFLKALQPVSIGQRRG